MEVVQIISEHRRKFCRRVMKDGKHGTVPEPVKHGCKRVMAIVDMGGYKTTKHMDIKK